MKRTVRWIAALAAGAAMSVSTYALAAADATLTVAQIVERHVEARGGPAAWRAVKTLTMSGQLDAGGKPDVELPYVLRLKREHKSRLELQFAGQTALQVYDGSHGWKVRPFLDRDEVEPYSAAELRSAAVWDDLDGPLIDHAAKGTKVELAGTETVDGVDTYRLRLTMANGDQRLLWLDAQSFLELKVQGEPRRLDGKLRQVSVYYRDFRREGALMVPHAMESVAEGVKGMRRLTVTKLAVNEPMDDALFAKPELVTAAARTPGTR